MPSIDETALRDRRRFVRLNAGIVAIALVVGAMVGALALVSPDAPATRVGRVYRASTAMPPPSERKAALDRARGVSASLAARLLMGPESARRLEQTTQIFDSTWHAQSEPTKAEQELAFAIDAVNESIVGTIIITLGLCGLLATCGLLGLLRLKVRGITILTASLLTLGAGAGGAVLALLDASRLWVGLLTLLCVAGLFGQLVATNLLPDSNHPFIVNAEANLRTLPPEQQRRYLTIRLAAGFGMSAIGVLGTLTSLFLIEGPVFTVFTGAFAGGLVIAAVPLIAAIRLRSRAHA